MAIRYELSSRYRKYYMVKHFITMKWARFRIWLAMKIMRADVAVIGATMENVRIEMGTEKRYVIAHNVLSGNSESNGRIS